MARIVRDTSAKLELPCNNPDDSFVVRYTNQGEPFREGIEIGIQSQDWNNQVTVMLCDDEAKQLRDTLMKLYPVKGDGHE